MPRRLAPQQKKRLSLARDRRNAYGENDKSSRRAIPANKRHRLRAYRHASRRALRVTLMQPGNQAEALDAAQHAASTVRPGPWRKGPDIPLAEHLRRRRARRVATGQQLPDPPKRR